MSVISYKTIPVWVLYDTLSPGYFWLWMYPRVYGMTNVIREGVCGGVTATDPGALANWGYPP